MLSSNYYIIKDKITEYLKNIINFDFNNFQPNQRIFPKQSYYQKYLMFYSEPTHIVDNIYIGSAYNASHWNTFVKYNFKFVINAAEELTNYFDYYDDLTYLKVGIKDNGIDLFDSYQHIYDSIISYNENNDGNILIHCHMGASRSASIVCYYLMKNKNMTANESVVYLRNRRDINLTTKLFDQLQNI